MAKIQKYSVIGSSKRNNGGYIKVSKLRELLIKDRDYYQSLELSSKGVRRARMLGKIEYANALLAAIDTEAP